MAELLTVVFSSFWHFVGTVILIEVVLGAPCRLINRVIRHMNIRSKGWPPAHCDADGDFKPEAEQESH